MDALSLVAVGLTSLSLGSALGWALARRRGAAVEVAGPEVEAPAPVAAVAEVPAPAEAVAPPPPAPVVQACQVPGCGREARLRGLCRSHYGKAYRLGFVEELTPEQLARLAQDRRRLPRPRAVLRVLPSPNR
jgi:hypothetical protein